MHGESMLVAVTRLLRLLRGDVLVPPSSDLPRLSLLRVDRSSDVLVGRVFSQLFLRPGPRLRSDLLLREPKVAERRRPDVALTLIAPRVEIREVIVGR